MAGYVAASISEKEEERLERRRSQLFKSDWSSGGFKALIRDLTPSKVYSEHNGFRIFVGSAGHASDLPLLEERGIMYILNMAASDPTCQMTQEIYGDGYTCMRIGAGDMPGYDISQHFAATSEFIEEVRRKGSGILVHCVAGASRSATVVIAYLMEKHNWSLEKAAKHVHARRARVFPNVGFVKHLIQLEKKLKHKEHPT